MNLEEDKPDFLNNGVGLIDFDNSCYTYLLWNVANFIYFWTWPPEKELNFNKAKNTLIDYSKYRKLSDIEKTHLYDALKMVIFMSLAWFIYEDKDFQDESKRITYLNKIGRKAFYNKLFEK